MRTANITHSRVAAAQHKTENPSLFLCVCVCVCTLVRAIEKPKYASEEENFHIVPIAGDEEEDEEEEGKKNTGKTITINT